MTANHTNNNKKKIIFGTVIGLIIIMVIAIAIVLTGGKKEHAPDDIKKYYANAVTQEKLDEQIGSGKATTVYFYSKWCQYCQKATPIVFPLAEELGVELVPYDIDEQPFQQYGINATPTIIFFKDKQAVIKVEGFVGEEKYREFFETQILTRLD